MHQVIILHFGIFSEEEVSAYINACEYDHTPIDLICEYAEQHQENNCQVACMSYPLTQSPQIGVTEGSNQQDPLVQKLWDSPGIPPILVKYSPPQLSQLSHGQQDVLHDEIVQTDIYVESRRDQSEEELEERHRTIYFRLKERTDYLREKNVIHQKAHQGHCQLDQEIRPMDF